MAPQPKPLLSMMGAAEAATGLVLAVAPSFLVELLLGAAPDTAAGTTVSRVAVAAIFALGVACWLARQDAASRAASGLIAAMLLYNSAVVAILVLAWTNQGLSGVALWPVVLAHTALAIWCVVALSAGNEEKR
jgi:phosphotransferase system  glucose/maltose/N-acetylglucosamine-specific IIC component